MKALTAVAVLAALLLGSLTSWSPAQSISSATALNPRGWPPRPSDIWNYNISGGTLPSGQELVLVTVPMNSWLVINSGRWSESNNGKTLVERTGSGDETKLTGDTYAPGIHYSALSTTLGGKVTPASPGPMGLVFQPGSQVVLKGGGQNDNLYSTQLYGYFVRD